MKDLPPLGNPHASMRMLIEGTGNRLRFWPSDNFGDDIRGHFFYDASRTRSTLGTLLSVRPPRRV